MFKLIVKTENAPRIRSALNNLRSTVNSVINTHLPKHLAERYRNHILAAILTQRSADYPETSTVGRRMYLEWKHAVVGHDRYWDLFGDLANAIRVRRVQGGYFSGVPASAMDKGGKSWFGTGLGDLGRRKPIAWYGWIMEEGGDYRSEGGGYHPPRPMFEPELDLFIMVVAERESRDFLARIEGTWA